MTSNPIINLNPNFSNSNLIDSNKEKREGVIYAS